MMFLLGFGLFSGVNSLFNSVGVANTHGKRAAGEGHLKLPPCTNNLPSWKWKIGKLDKVCNECTPDYLITPPKTKMQPQKWLEDEFRSKKVTLGLMITCQFLAMYITWENVQQKFWGWCSKPPICGTYSSKPFQGILNLEGSNFPQTH